MILPPDNAHMSLEFERDHVGVWYDGVMILKRRLKVWRSFVLELERERGSSESDQKRHRRNEMWLITPGEGARTQHVSGPCATSVLLGTSTPEGVFGNVRAE
jgi:hypothetical protein